MHAHVYVHALHVVVLRALTLFFGMHELTEPGIAGVAGSLFAAGGASALRPRRLCRLGRCRTLLCCRLRPFVVLAWAVIKGSCAHLSRRL